MGFRFFKRIPLGRFLRLNLTTAGASLSLGVPGAWITFGPRGPSVSVGIPGTGIYYRQHLGRKGSKKRTQRIAPGLLERLFLSEETEAFLDGLQAYVEGREDEALQRLSRSNHPDARFLRAVLLMRRGALEEAAALLYRVLEEEDKLGERLKQYDVWLHLELPVTETLDVVIFPDGTGVRLLLIEVLQASGRISEARAIAEELYRKVPADPIVRLSLIELLLEGTQEPPWQRILKLTDDIQEPETPVHTALLYYRGKALRALGYAEAAYQALTKALRRRKGRPEALLRAIRYERALALEALGRRAQARREFERIYAEDPYYEDVAERLGLI